MTQKMAQRMFHLGSLLFVAVLLGALAPAARSQAFQLCSITAIDARTEVVSAKVNASKVAFQFRVTDAALLKSLKVGEEVYANFTTKQVSLDGKRMLGEIINPPQPAAPPAGLITVPKSAPSTANAPAGKPAPGASPAVGGVQNKLGPVQSCIITAMNTYTGVVTAKENATGQIITIAHLQSIDGAKLFQTFKVGGKVDLQSIDGPALTSGSNVRVTVQGLQSIDGVVSSTSSGATSTAAQPAGSAKTLAAAGSAAVMQNVKQLGGLPKLSYGTPHPAPSGPRGMPARWESRGTYVHIRGYDGIEQAQGIPEGVKTMLKIHVMALEPGEPDHYLVNPQLAQEWSNAHPLPPDIKPPSTSDGHTGCNALSLHCAGEAAKHAEDETSRQADMFRKQAQDDWRNASKELTTIFHEAEGCFADATLSPLNIPIEFAASPSVGIHLEQSGKTTLANNGSASGKAEGTVNLALPVKSPDFQASLEVSYIPCLPFMIRPKSLSGNGTLTVGSKLTAAVKATGQFEETIPTGSLQIPIQVIPIVLFGVPIAEMDVSAYVEGNIEVGGEGTFTANFELDNPHELKLNFRCDGHGCTGPPQPVAVPTTAAESAQLNGRIHVKPMVFTAIQLDFDFDALTVRAGPQPYLYGELYGCVGGAATQNVSSGSSTAQGWYALTADLDWGLDSRAEALIAGKQVGPTLINRLVSQNPPKHIGFWDLAHSTALLPQVQGLTQASLGEPAVYQIKMPTCYPYPDKVKYQLAWTGGASASSGASGATGANRSAARPGAALKLVGNGAASTPTNAPGPCNLQSGQGSCEFDPAKDFALDLVWPAAGTYNLAVTAIGDTHGREYKSAQPTTSNVAVQ